MNRAKLPHRTHKTPLSDDELLLFDAVFDTAILALPHFSAEGYSELFNVPYSHSMPLETVRETLERQVRWGHMKRGDEWQGEPTYGLSPAGGRLWELEREPRWERYCDVATYLDDSELRITSPTAETASDYFEVAVASGRHHPDVKTIPTPIELPDADEDPLIPWRRFPRVYTIRVPESWEPNHRDMDSYCYYEQHRSWWLSISELQSFVGFGHG